MGYERTSQKPLGLSSDLVIGASTKNSDLLPNVGGSMLAPGSITKGKAEPNRASKSIPKQQQEQA
jgi:hypothetical protein